MSFWMREGGEMCHGDSSEGEERWIDSRYLLEVEFM